VISGWALLVTVAEKACTAPSSTLAEFGAMLKVMSLATVNVARPDLLASAWLVAVICTVAGDGRSIGAVYAPAGVIVPSVVLPPVTPFTLQSTAVSVVFDTVAVKVVWFPSSTEPVGGLTATTIDGGGGGGSGCD
jgi:hypothetical protein